MGNGILMRWPWQEKQLEVKEASLESVLRQWAALFQTVSGITVNAETCMQSPTVHAIVTSVQNRLGISPLHVLQKTTINNRPAKVEQPNHPIAQLLRKPNDWQTTEEYISDAASSLLRHGQFFSLINSGGNGGRIQALLPLDAGQVEVEQDKNWRVSFKYKSEPFRQEQILYARGGARDFLKGDSPIVDIRESIALEIAAEQYGAAFFGNGAMPLIYFKLMDGFADFQTDEEKKTFLERVKEQFGGNKKFSTMMLPKGMDMDALTIENDKAQFVESRKFIRTVIAGAFGVPPHLVGDLERATFNNVEQQDVDFTINVVLPIAKRLEAAMERDLLTDEDREQGVIIRFNLDAVQRADIKTRNESLKIAREWGAINANEWREMLNLNPISEDDGGEDYIRPMNMAEAGAEPVEVDEDAPIDDV